MKKYIPFIVGYAIYASSVLMAIADARRDYWQLFIMWLITIPLVVGCIIYFVFKSKNRSSIVFKDEVLPKDTVFEESWTLLDFARMYGPNMQVDASTKANGYRPSCRFIKKDGTITYVRFFSQLGILTASEISKRKNELYIGKVSSGNFYLHAGNVKAWETVELEIE